ncbi:unnamed protein product [Paramecium sonneborni]|uniref:Uncharacterized protein n=1 Tax=Paramecium sonneborni TaxID=65129 RepID=A0A8S1MJ82_9CILI|nr:unnamed protein product [Paramecium sonneborni]
MTYKSYSQMIPQRSFQKCKLDPKSLLTRRQYDNTK